MALTFGNPLSIKSPSNRDREWEQFGRFIKIDMEGFLIRHENLI